MNGQSTPQFVQAILEWQWTWPIARFALMECHGPFPPKVQHGRSK
jgi:hypothetical protein